MIKNIYCLIAASVLFASCTHKPDAPKTHLAPDVTLTRARVETFAQTAPASGRIGGVNGSLTKVSFVLPGVISAIDVQIGERVSAGQVLASLDDRGYALNAQSARADVSVADANVRQAAVDRFSTRIKVDEAAVRRERTLYAAGVAPHKDVDAAEAVLSQDQADAAVAREQVSSNAAQVQSAQVHEAIADRDLQNTALRAPVDGVVTAIYRRAGETIDQTSPVLALSPLQVREITLSVSAQDLDAIHAGDSVRFEIIGTDLQSTGQITGVSNAMDPTTQTATVIATGFPTSAPIGSIVQGTIVVAYHRGVVIPESAVVQDPQTGNAVVFMAAASRDGSVSFHERVVKVAMRNSTLALIASGLRPGEQVASRGGFALLAPADGGDD
jgi:cobalt-zinc-cadmium efflux system membrane fusion protein